MRFHIEVAQARTVMVRVEARDRDSAVRKALANVTKVKGQFKCTVMHLSQQGEPWAYCEGWYDLRGIGDVIVVRRAEGCLFTRRDEALLRGRLERLSLKVRDQWSGADFHSVSFHCEGRRGGRPMSKADLKVLLAPRRKV